MTYKCAYLPLYSISIAPVVKSSCGYYNKSMADNERRDFTIIIEHDDSINAGAEEVPVMLTNVQFHTSIPRKPAPWYRAVMKAIRTKKEHRAYTTDISESQDGVMLIHYSLSPEQRKEVEAIEKAGKHVKFVDPPGGLLVYMGEDMRQYVAAQKKKAAEDYKEKRGYKKWK